jgi:cbb3-type cytochrome oxidase maturation protein
LANTPVQTGIPRRSGYDVPMDVLLWLIPVAVSMGFLGLLGFLWALKSGQYDDLDGAAHRILFDDEPPPEQPAEQRRKS